MSAILAVRTAPLSGTFLRLGTRREVGLNLEDYGGARGRLHTGGCARSSYLARWSQRPYERHLSKADCKETVGWSFCLSDRRSRRVPSLFAVYV